MSHATVSAALSSQLNTLDFPTAWENANFEPPAGELYLSEQLLPSGTIPVGVSSSSSDLFEGIYQVLVHAPVGAGKGAGAAAVAMVEALFARGLRVDYGAHTVTIRRTEVNAAFKSGERYLTPISVYYRMPA